MKRATGSLNPQQALRAELIALFRNNDPTMKDHQKVFSALFVALAQIRDKLIDRACENYVRFGRGAFHVSLTQEALAHVACGEGTEEDFPLQIGYILSVMFGPGERDELLAHLIRYDPKSEFVVYVDAPFSADQSYHNCCMITQCKISDIRDRLVPKCDFCGKLGPKFRCSKCQLVRYCSKQCQTRHWKHGHKVICDALKENARLRSEQDKLSQRLRDLEIDDECE